MIMEGGREKITVEVLKLKYLFYVIGWLLGKGENNNSGTGTILFVVLFNFLKKKESNSRDTELNFVLVVECFLLFIELFTKRKKITAAVL